MARTPTISHPMRTIRHSIGESQSLFAERIGVTRHAIVAIENGHLKMSPKLAAVVQVETGANAEELLKYNRTGKPSGEAICNLDGKPYTDAHFKIWKSRFLVSSTEEISKKLENISTYSDVLLTAAARKDRLHGAWMTVAQAIESARNDLGLVDETEKVMEEKSAGFKDVLMWWVLGGQPAIQKPAKKRPSRKRSVKSQTKP